jgi:hypothetical protein
MLTIVAILGFGLFAGIRLVPMYIEYFAVVKALERTAKENPGGSQQELRTSLIRQWTVDNISSIEPKDVEITRAKDGYVMRAWYRAEAPFLGNVSLVVDFDKSVPVGGATLAGT